MTIRFTPFLTSQLICFIPAIIGGLITAPAIPAWYQGLQKPALNPPNWLFGPVWTVLYFLQGISLYLLRQTEPGSFDKKLALGFFYAQLILNLGWSVIFFGFRQPKLALMEIVLLVFIIIFTIWTSWLANRKASLMLFPYLAWVSFATYLNLMIAVLNRPA